VMLGGDHLLGRELLLAAAQASISATRYAYASVFTSAASEVNEVGMRLYVTGRRCRPRCLLRPHVCAELVWSVLQD
jgi:hypothetical protein